jgi:diacylglycerol kinase family enzyme
MISSPGVTAPKPHDVALLCNPRAGGRWKVLASVLDSEEAKAVHRIVTDDIDDVREAIAGLGQRVKLLCIYGGDGTIYRVINELLRDAKSPPRLALLGGGTMNVTSAWCGMKRSPGENFRTVMRAYHADRLLFHEVPLVSVSQNGRTTHGFTFGLGPVVRILVQFESGTKTKLRALSLGVKSVAGALGRLPGKDSALLKEMEARITVDGQVVPYDKFVAAFANVTGMINPFITPYVGERTRESFHFLAYAISSREFAMMTPLLARARLPIDPRSLLNPVSHWRQALLSLVGKDQLPQDPRYLNRPASLVKIETDETHYTIDGEVFPSQGGPFELSLGPTLQVAKLNGATRVKKLPKKPKGELADK